MLAITAPLRSVLPRTLTWKPLSPSLDTGLLGHAGEVAVGLLLAGARAAREAVADRQTVTPADGPWFPIRLQPRPYGLSLTSCQYRPCLSRKQLARSLAYPGVSKCLTAARRHDEIYLNSDEAAIERHFQKYRSEQGDGTMETREVCGRHKASIMTQRLVMASAVLILAACALPEGGPAELRAIENVPGCKVWGTWPRYTWTGQCEQGLTTGYGTLEGYSNWTKMMSYTGEMAAGRRHGKGTLWLNGDRIYGGPETRTGIFDRNTLVSGTKSDNDTVITVRDGKEVARTSLSSSSSSDQNSTLSLLGAAFSAIGATSRSANAPTYQSLGSALSSASQDSSNPAMTALEAVKSAPTAAAQPQTRATKDCDRPQRSPADSVSKCQCQGGQPEQVSYRESRYVGCSLPDSRFNWGCSYFNDGKIQCSIR